MKIWLIDDDSMTNMIHEAVIRKYDASIETVVFQYPVKAFESLKTRQDDLPDLILLDLNMPEMDGWQFMDSYATLGLSIPIWVVSSSVDEVDRVNALSHDCVKAYVAKPLKVPMVNDMIQHGLKVPVQSSAN